VMLPDILVADSPNLFDDFIAVHHRPSPASFPPQSLIERTWA
jgi:hypothetical protein